MKRRGNFVKTNEKLNEAVNAIEINDMENYISEVLEQTNFEHLVMPKEEKKEAHSFLKNADFISVVEKKEELLTEEEFFNLVGVHNKRLSSHAGRYQQSLYSHYMRAKREKDDGYRKDVLMKAQILKENIKEAEMLMQNEAFMREWALNVGRISPIRDLQENGRMRRINIVRSYIE